ncbi:glycerophosphoinositol inositolphosphodiesterase gdpd2 [Limosa lapponica baueri]|uniref:Glycerophosphoinositol inositolphosphodiesterase gdpd2 n=1 Tax=Limosa lapponica baueri TaxID=1758121 RepID=A0A2I0TC16_LIMLA|nr:glycerophosphoinositol inositolphosphodiesterase gdpd2 [Limosa lapponica baueri]
MAMDLGTIAAVLDRLELPGELKREQLCRYQSGGLGHEVSPGSASSFQGRPDLDAMLEPGLMLCPGRLTVGLGQLGAMACSPGCCHPCATCLLCLYSCHWVTAKKRKGLKTTKCDCSWFLFLFCVFLFMLVWLYFAIIILNDFHNFNEFIFKQRKLWLDWSLVLLIATAVLITYSAALLVLALCLQLCGQPLKLHWLHKILLILSALVVAAAFTGLGIKWAEEWRSARISLQATGPFLHIGIVGGMTLLAWPLASFIYRTHNTGLKVFLLLVYSAVMIALYLAPLGITSPCIMEENQLPPKPALVGHRGAPMVSDQPQQRPGTVVRVDGAGCSISESQAVPAGGALASQTLVAAGLGELWPVQY